jgi:hypothetical protein
VPLRTRPRHVFTWAGIAAAAAGCGGWRGRLPTDVPGERARVGVSGHVPAREEGADAACGVGLAFLCPPPSSS